MSLACTRTALRGAIDLLAVGACIGAVASPALSETMICKGSGKAYTLSFDPALNTLKSSAENNALVFTVTNVEALSVSGTTKDEGATFLAVFDGKKRFQLFYHSRLMQTVLCR